MFPTPTPACPGDCPAHQRPCELPPGHSDAHDCPGCDSYRRRQWRAVIAGRAAAHRVMQDIGLVVTPDVD